MEPKIKNLLKRIEDDPTVKEVLSRASNEDEKKMLREITTLVAMNMSPLLDFALGIKGDPQKLKELKDLMKGMKEEKKDE